MAIRPLVFVLVAVAALFAATVAAAPATTVDRVVAAVSAPLASAREIWTSTLTGTNAPLFTDLPAGKFGVDGLTQSVTIESKRTNDAAICVKAYAIPVPVVGATDSCAEVCTVSAGSMTCSDAATDGQWIDPGETLPLRDTAAFCYCAEAASGTQKVQAVRSVR